MKVRTGGSIRALRGCLRTSRETANLWVSQKRTSAAEAVKHRRFTARLKPCPSYRDAFSFRFLAVAMRQQVVQNAPADAVPFARQSLPQDFMRRLKARFSFGRSALRTPRKGGRQPR